MKTNWKNQINNNEMSNSFIIITNMWKYFLLKLYTFNYYLYFWNWVSLPLFLIVLVSNWPFWVRKIGTAKSFLSTTTAPGLLLTYVTAESPQLTPYSFKEELLIYATCWLYHKIWQQIILNKLCIVRIKY